MDNQAKLTFIKYINDNQTMWAMLENDVLMSVFVDDDDTQHIVGNIYLGRIERVLNDVGAAFVQIGRKLKGFLPLKESPSFHQLQGKAPLITGNEVLVQVKKDEKGKKGAFLTRDIALAGQYVMVMPMNKFIGVSKRVEEDNQREELRLMGEKITSNRYGVIMRHAALFAKFEDVEAEAEQLYQRFCEFQNGSEFLKAPTLIEEKKHVLEACVNDYHARFDCEIITDLHIQQLDSEMAKQHVVPSIELEAICRSKRIEEKLKDALRRLVVLKGGGSLIIDEREALSTIDVNSGKQVFSKDGKNLSVEMNLNAIPEIARQIRLRNLSGIIIIDFMDMNSDEERNLVSQALSVALSGDTAKHVIHGFTQLGLLEMTRKRTRESLREMLTMPCSHCGAIGYVLKLNK